jgi:hypothetical protein
VVKGEFLFEDEHQHWSEVWQKGRCFHQKQHHKRYRLSPWRYSSTYSSCEDYYRLEKHTIWNGIEAYGYYEDED